MVFALMHNQFDNIEKRLYIVSLEEIKNVKIECLNSGVKVMYC
jgi:hypothetical protein